MLQINTINSGNIVNKTSNTHKNSFGQKPKLMQHDDIFIKSISFGNSYNRDDAIDLIDKIKKDSVKDSGSGVQAKFYKINDNYGIKAPNPIYPKNADADTYGHNNIKENFALNKIKSFDSDIVPEAKDLIEKDGKYYLAMDVVNGKHPMDSTLTSENLKDIIDKSFKLDTNGILHCDLQSGNIFLNNSSKVTFIDLGSYSILDNDGHYIDSDNYDYNKFFKNGEIESETNLNNKSKFTRALFNNDYKYDIKNYSDNPYLNIKSNISNFEFRTLYDYLIKNHKNQPVKIFKDYLNLKTNTYHQPMIEFLKSLNVDEKGKLKINQAIEHENLFKEVFKNPSENVIKIELGKIQLKWLANDQQGKKYVKSVLNDYIIATKGYQQQATGLEKKYFDGILSVFRNLVKLQNLQAQPDNILLEDNKNIIKIIFEQVTPARENLSKPISQTAEIVKKTNKKLYIIIAAIASGLCASVYILNKRRKSINSQPTSEIKPKGEGKQNQNNTINQNAVVKTSTDSPFENFEICSNKMQPKQQKTQNQLKQFV